MPAEPRTDALASKAPERVIRDEEAEACAKIAGSFVAERFDAYSTRWTAEKIANAIRQRIKDRAEAEA